MREKSSKIKFDIKNVSPFESMILKNKREIEQKLIITQITTYYQLSGLSYHMII